MLIRLHRTLLWLLVSISVDQCLVLSIMVVVLLMCVSYVLLMCWVLLLCLVRVVYCQRLLVCIMWCGGVSVTCLVSDYSYSGVYISVRYGMCVFVCVLVIVSVC